ncbi:CHAD domain-containing protein [Mucilaginibacter sp. NFX135]|uniref:CHAD domain-containing protein n=1 Tax=Mucilaginibacter sp. NFX135 TaxID=3402687 RepID=UPI003AFB37FB
MKKKNGIKYFKEEWKRMKAYLKSYLKKGQQEDLHRFRVQVKKLRAFFTLSDTLSPHSNMNKKFKLVKKIFKEAGKLRNTYIKHKLADRPEPNTRTSPDLPIAKASRKFRLKVLKYLKKTQSVHGVLKKNIKSIKNSSVHQFYEDQLQQIAGALAPLQFNEKLHECRKRIKVLLYNYQLVQATLGITLNEDYLKQLQEAIGNWHDYLLSPTRLSGDHTTDTTVNVMNKQQQKLKEDIISLTHDFYYRATTAGM